MKVRCDDHTDRRRWGVDHHALAAHEQRIDNQRIVGEPIVDLDAC